MEQVLYKSRINGAFTGWNGNAVFELENGKCYEQINYKYSYHYQYRPNAFLFRDNGRLKLLVEGMSDSINVTEISKVIEGNIDNEFNGFKDRETVFSINGYKFAQDEYKYSYYYSYRPIAKIYNTSTGLRLYVDGMGDSVSVRRM